MKSWKHWKDLGVPEKIDDYKIEVPKPKRGAPDNVMAEAIRKVAFEHKVLPEAAQAMVGEINAEIERRLDSLEAAGAKNRADLEKGLRDKYKLDYDAKHELGLRAAKALGASPELLARMNGDMPDLEMVDLFIKIGEAGFAEAKIIGNQDGAGGAAGKLSPQAAAAERARLTSDPEWLKKFTNQRHPEHKAARARFHELVEMEAAGLPKQAAE